VAESAKSCVWEGGFLCAWAMGKDRAIAWACAVPLLCYLFDELPKAKSLEESIRSFCTGWRRTLTDFFAQRGEVVDSRSKTEKVRSFKAERISALWVR
jgi:hypothetical protein